MAECNKLMWMGRLVEEPSLRYTPAGAPVCKIRVVSNHLWYDKRDQSKKEEATFLNWTFFSETGETLSKMVHKGTQLWLEGRLKQDDFTDKQGNKRTSYEAIGDKWQFLSPKPKIEADGVRVNDEPQAEEDVPF